MSVSCCILLLLSSVLSLCEATEFYVRPTEPSNTACPGQPCLTLSQYISDSDHYFEFQSNIVFKFLPGIHHMDRPLIMRNMYNISLESYKDEQTQLVSQFLCRPEVTKCVSSPYNNYNPLIVDKIHICCAIIWLHDINLLIVKRLTIVPQAPNVSSLFLQEVVNVTIELVEAYPIIENTSVPQNGIVVIGSHFVKMQSLVVKHWFYSLIFIDSNNIHLSNIIASKNIKGGILTQNSSNFQLSSSCLTNNLLEGISMVYGYNVIIQNTTSTYNSDGIFLFIVSLVQIVNSITSNNRLSGINLCSVNNTNISNITASHNGNHGIVIFASDYCYMDGITATYNAINGVYLMSTQRVYITTIKTAKNYVKGTSLSNAQILIHFSKHICIYNTLITVEDTDVSNSAELLTQPAIIITYRADLNLSGCTFTGNRISAIKAIASTIILSGDLIFSNNTAFTGTAFILIEESTLMLAENCLVHFINNHATNTGGVFALSNTQHVTIKSACNIPVNKFVGSNVCPITTSACFLLPPTYLNGTKIFTFVNNSAGKGGDIAYGGYIAYGFIEHNNCMDVFKNISYISETSLSLISSDPLRVCLCNESGLPDCMLLIDPTVHFVYPGQTIRISAVVVGQAWGTVAGSVYAQFLHKSASENTIHLKSSQIVQNTIKHSCISLQYTIFSRNENMQQMLVLTALDIYVTDFQDDYSLLFIFLYGFYKASQAVLQTIYYKTNPVYLNITILPCPPGFHIRTSEPFLCDCNKLLEQMSGVQCHIQEQNIGRSGLVWVGMIDNEDGPNRTVAVSQYCPSNYCSKGERNVTLNEPDSQCNYNHSGTLCGGCKPGLSLALGSTRCLSCSNDYLTLLIPFTLAGPALVFFIKWLDLTVSQGTLNGLIFFANILQANDDIFLPWRSTHPLTIFIAWLNLDLGVETCFFHGLDAYTKAWLQFLFPIYIWSIAGLIIILAKYSDRLAKLMGNNSVPVLATLFLFSYAKLVRTIITALSYTTLCTSHSCKAVWTADGNIGYLGPKHAPLFATSVVILLFLWLPYILILFLGRWLHKCRSRLIIKMLIKIKPFLDAHYAPLKERQHFWFGALHLMRVTILLISALVPYDHSNVVAISIQAFAVILIPLSGRFYRNSAVSVFNMLFYMNLVLFSGAHLYTKTPGGDAAVAAYVLISMAFLQFICLVIFKMACKLNMMQTLTEWVQIKQNIDDDWELYEQAALLREMESGTEEDSENSGSTESLPTY